MKTKNLLAEAASLPIEERVTLVDLLLKSLNAPEADIDREWIKVAKKRLLELRSGAVKPIPGKEVFDKIRKRISK